ncbi:MAG TPA: threonine synthase [Anaerolineales bacterium]|nr:threonine synthase [Anaerolineales bacterium]
MSYLTHLECSGCGQRFDVHVIQTFCPACQAPLVALYDLISARQQLDRDEFRTRVAGMWRWRELLPVLDPLHILYLGEGDTPLLPVPRLGSKLGLSSLYVKDESLNPTGTFKARGLSAAISKAKELGVKRVIIPTAGNAGGAMAAYAARGGLQAHIFMPKDTPLANIEESRIAGATVILIDGLISEAAGMAGEKARREGWFDVSTFKEPYRAEGKKTMAYELAEAFGWKLPDVIVYPTGGGTGLVAMWKAFAEMDALGWLEEQARPRMVAVQADGCAPVVKAFDAGQPFCDFWTNAHTAASGLRVPKSFADQLILKALNESHGTAIAVSDDEILAAQQQLAYLEGIFAAPEGAATLAGLIKLVESKWIKPHEKIVLFNTGTGLKYLHQDCH